jgi:hypothetical protein
MEQQRLQSIIQSDFLDKATGDFELSKNKGTHTDPSRRIVKRASNYHRQSEYGADGRLRPGGCVNRSWLA